MAIKTITTNLYMCDKCGHESSDGNDFMTSDLPSIVLSSDRDVVNTVWFKYFWREALLSTDYRRTCTN